MRYVDLVKNDIERYLVNTYGIDTDSYKKVFEDTDSLHDELWVDDSVTGNSTGSYTCNRELARSFVLGDMETVIEAAYDYGCIEEFTDRLLKRDYEWLDVLARCYVLGEAISIVEEKYK